MKFEKADDISDRISDIVEKLNFNYIDARRIKCIRSFKTSNNAVARIWSLPNVWQKVLNVEAHYIVEVISERFDKLSKEDQIKTLIHELMHVPKSFSGALVSHNTKQFDGKGGHVSKKITPKTVDKLYKEYQRF
ncbi:MAG: metallopeptidase [Nanoarchaeota archaeon]|nr:metallopeptidase [Nanoarchaeota archaeon]MBU4124359.1 metallopeptidase [Nanoarchaeota archaeon]